MQLIKKNDDYIVVKKRSGRFGVRTNAKQWINGDPKIEILVKEGLIKAALPKKQAAPEAEAAPAEQVAAEPKAEEV